MEGIGNVEKALVVVNGERNDGNAERRGRGEWE